jgi:transposase
MNLTRSQWSLLTPLIAQGAGPRRRGRPSQDARAVLDGIFWVMRTGARWADLPSRYPPYQTCHRRFRAWLDSGLLFECLRRLAADLELHPAPDGDSLPGAAASRSWRWNIALLLQSPLGRLALLDGGASDRHRAESSDRAAPQRIARKLDGAGASYPSRHKATRTIAMKRGEPC